MLRRDSPALTALLAALTALGPLSTDMYLASLPAMTRALATDVASVQLTLSVFLAGFALSQLFYGPLSDRFGRKPVLLAGLLLFAAAGIACALAASIEALIAARFVQALGACAGVVLARAIVRDLHEREHAARMLSYIAAAMGLAPAVAPVIGGYLHVAFGWQATFYALAGTGAALAAAVALLLGETNRQPDPLALRPRRLAANFAGLMRSRAFLGYALMLGFGYAGLFSFISGSSFVLVDVFGVAEDAYGYHFTAIVVGYIIGTTLGGRYSLRLGLDAVLGLGAGTVAAAGLGMALLAWGGAHHPATVTGPMIAYMVGLGMVLPQGMAGALSPFPRTAGAAAALAGFIQIMLAAAVGTVVGHLHDGSELPMASAIGFAGLATLATYRLLVRGAARGASGD